MLLPKISVFKETPIDVAPVNTEFPSHTASSSTVEGSEVPSLGLAEHIQHRVVPEGVMQLQSGCQLCLRRQSYGLGG